MPLSLVGVAAVIPNEAVSIVVEDSFWCQAGHLGQEASEPFSARKRKSGAFTVADTIPAILTLDLSLRPEPDGMMRGCERRKTADE